MRWILLFALLLAAAAPPLDPWAPRSSVALADDDDGGDDDGGGDDGGDDDGGDDDVGDDGAGGGGSGSGSDSGGDDDSSGDDDDDDDDSGRGRGRSGNSDDDDEEDEEEDDDDRRGRGRGGREDSTALGRFIDGLLGEDQPGSDRDPLERVSQELIAYDLTSAERAALAARGFPAIATTTLGGLGSTLDRLRAPAGLALDDALAAARQAAPGAALDVNHLYRSNGAPCAGEACWGAMLVRLSASPADACAQGAPVAIVDTAVDMTHPTLKDAAITARSFLPEGVDPAPADHGTAVAALLVGRVAPGAPPLAPGARLLAAEAFALRDGRLRADAAAVVRALDWAISSRARVVGLSLAGPGNAVLERAVAAAGRRTSLVAAAGNDGPRAAPAYPAAYPEVIAVAALDSRKRAWRGGNRGDYIEIAAPGVDVVSAAPGGGTSAWTGTSFAVPFAVAAMLRARAEAGGDPSAARAVLARSAEDIGAPGRDDASGHGLVRAPGPRCF